MDKVVFHDMTIMWLNGGITKMDGGAMFGPVPKTLWKKRYPANHQNQIELPTEPMLIQYNGKNYLIDAGIGDGRLSDKQKRNFGVSEEATIEQDLHALGLTTNDIDVVLMTHLHFDHVTGLVEKKTGSSKVFFRMPRFMSMKWNGMKFNFRHVGQKEHIGKIIGKRSKIKSNFGTNQLKLCQVLSCTIQVGIVKGMLFLN